MSDWTSPQTHEPRRVLITGVSSGLGWGMARQCLARGDEVYAISRRGPPEPHPRLHEIRHDLTRTEGIPGALETLLAGVDRLDLVFLNAGVLGPVAPMNELLLDDYPALQRIHDARGTERMLGPDDAARRILEALPRLRSYPSGAYVDIREMGGSES